VRPRLSARIRTTGRDQFVSAAEPVTARDKYEMSAIRGPLAFPLISVRRPIERQWVNITAICIHFENSQWIA
jgi:hypothetical protein